MTEDRQNYVGMDVFVFKRKPTNKFPEDCNSDWKRAWAEFLDNEYGDVAIANDYLFLDLGTGHSRGMEIVFLGDKKQVAQFGFQAAGEFSIQADELTYRGHLGTWRDPKWEVIKECVWQPDQSRDLNQEDYTGILRVNLKTGAKKVSSVSCTVGPAAG